MDHNQESMTEENTPEATSPVYPIFLIGYMASGKTTFGRALARCLGREFIDLDFAIEQRFHKSISRIFAEEGEETFRRRETAMLREVGEFENVVIACGGGTPCFGDNMEYMNARGLTVRLNAGADRIMERLMINSAKRPLMAGKDPTEMRLEVERGLQSREPFYSRAKISICGERLENREQIGETLDKFISEHGESL